jgi:hypothetical protein
MPLRFLIVDATEGTEVRLYAVDGRDAPKHMKKYLSKTGKREFENVYQDSAETLDGLVDEDSERAEERAEEVWEWICECTSPENLFKPGDARQLITHSISLVTA